MKDIWHIDHVCGHASHQTRHREFVDVRKGIILDVVKHILAQIAGKAGRSGGAGAAGCDAEKQRQDGHNHKLDAIADDDVHATAGLHLIHQIGDDKRDDALQDDFHGDQKRRQDCHLFEFTDAAGKGFDHTKHTSFIYENTCGSTGPGRRLSVQIRRHMRGGL